jgi:hypothetical protein
VTPTSAPALTVGERVRLDLAGPVYAVTRVTPCAAYLRGGRARVVELPNGRTFEAHANEVIPVSRNASVYREHGA